MNKIKLNIRKRKDSCFFGNTRELAVIDMDKIEKLKHIMVRHPVESFQSLNFI